MVAVRLKDFCRFQQLPCALDALICILAIEFGQAPSATGW